MPLKKTEALTPEQFKNIVKTIQEGFLGHRPNDRIATLLAAQGNLGLRISDILNLKLNDIVWSYNHYHIEIVEQKTKKKRDFTVPTPILEYLKDYAKRHNIKEDELLFKISERRVNNAINDAADYLNYDTSKIASHSFRKFFATQIYINNNYNIALVQKLLQHSSPSITQHYISMQQKDIEQALENNVMLPTNNTESKETKGNKGSKGKGASKSKTERELKREILERMLAELEDE